MRGALKWQSRKLSIISGALAIALCSMEVKGGKEAANNVPPHLSATCFKRLRWEIEWVGKSEDSNKTWRLQLRFITRGIKDLANHANISQATHASSPTNVLLINPSGRFLFGERVFFFNFFKKGVVFILRFPLGKRRNWQMNLKTASLILPLAFHMLGTSRGRKYGHEQWCLIRTDRPSGSHLGMPVSYKLNWQGDSA